MDFDPRGAAVRRLLNLARRILFFGGLALSLWLVFLTDFRPMFRLRLPDFAAQQKRIIVFDDDDREVRNLPLEQYIDRVTADRTIAVQGEPWREIFERALQSERRGQAVPEWSWRVAPAFSATAGFFFAEDEPPVAELTERVPKRETAYLKHPALPGVILDAFHTGAHEIGIIGDGPVDEVPAAFAYPYRRAALWVAVLACCAYVLLPWPRRRDRVVDMSNFRLLLMDVVTFLLLICLYALPLLIVGGSVEALTVGIFVTAMTWILAAFGLVTLVYTIRYAAFRVHVLDEAFVIETLSGAETFRYDEIEVVEKLLLVPPRWLTLLTAVSAPLAPTAGTAVGQAGRAELLAGSACSGLRLRARDGRSICIWFTAASGGVIFRNFELVPEALERAGVHVADAVETIRAFFPPKR